MIVMNDALLLALICAMLIVLGLWQHKADTFDLRWLLVDTKTNKVSLSKTGQLIALIVSSWALIYETRNGNLTEWLFGAYMISWAGANIANKVTEKYKSLEPPKESKE